jgi:hypothetical protein
MQHVGLVLVQPDSGRGEATMTQTRAKFKFKQGDRVIVTPRNPNMPGKGQGVVEHVGPTGLLLRVKFPDCKYPLACFAADCAKQ